LGTIVPRSAPEALADALLRGLGERGKVVGGEPAQRGVGQREDAVGFGDGAGEVFGGEPRESLFGLEPRESLFGLEPLESDAEGEGLGELDEIGLVLGCYRAG